MNPIIALLAVQTSSSVVTKSVEFKIKSEVFEDFVATPAKLDASKPTVLIIHDWNGSDGHEQQYAIKLAEAGYRAIAVDLYGKGVRPTTPAECSKEANKYYQNVALFHDRLASRVRDKKTKFVSIGFCFGGTAVLQMARENMNVVGVASFHGGLKPLSQPIKPISARILVLHGNADPVVPVSDVISFKNEFLGRKADLDFVGYPDAVHAFAVKFTKSGAPAPNYQEAAANASWAQLLSWLEFNF